MMEDPRSGFAKDDLLLASSVEATFGRLLLDLFCGLVNAKTKEVDNR